MKQLVEAMKRQKRLAILYILAFPFFFPYGLYNEAKQNGWIK